MVGIAVDVRRAGTTAGDDTTTPQPRERAVIEVLLVDLEDGAVGQQPLPRTPGGQPGLTVSTAEDAGQAGRTVTPIVQALYLAAALVAVVTLLVAGQVLARQAAAEAADDPTLAGPGLDRVDLVGLRVAKAMVMGVVAGFVGRGCLASPSPRCSRWACGIAEPDTASTSTGWFRSARWSRRRGIPPPADAEEWSRAAGVALGPPSQPGAILRGA